MGGVERDESDAGSAGPLVLSEGSLKDVMSISSGSCCSREGSEFFRDARIAGEYRSLCST